MTKEVPHNKSAGSRRMDLSSVTAKAFVQIWLD